MGAPGLVLGPFEGCLGPELVAAYAAATKDPSPRVGRGEAVPPVAVVTQIWEAQTAGRELESWRRLGPAARGGVHGEHDITLHRPLVVGEALHTTVSEHGTRPAGANAAVTLRYVTRDADDAIVVEQWWTTVLLGVTCSVTGRPAPDHAFPEDARNRSVGTYRVEVDADMARRYAEVSGDWSPHHFEPESARRSGSDEPFLHGLCSMALAAQGVVELVTPDAPERVVRVAARFAGPLPLGAQLEVHVVDAGGGSFAFEGLCRGARVLTHGRLELR